METAIPMRSRKKVSDLLIEALTELRHNHPNEALSLHTDNVAETKSTK